MTAGALACSFGANASSDLCDRNTILGACLVDRKGKEDTEDAANDSEYENEGKDG